MRLHSPKLDPLKINIGTKNELEILGFTPDRNKKILTIILCILTGGFLLLILSWRPSIRLKFTHLPCPSREATVLLVRDIYGQTWEEEVEEETLVLEERKFTKRKCFYNKKIKYFWDDECALFTRVSYPPEGTRLSEFPHLNRGLTSADIQQRQQIFGENKINIESQTIWHLFVRQAYNPFYIFQAYTIILWCLQSYYVYSGCIFLLSVISIVLNIWETKRQTKVLREKMITESQVQALRDGNVRVLDSNELVPGDVILLENGAGLLEADLVLLEGSIIMNEAILTGESVPVTKVHVSEDDEEVFDPEKHKRYILHGGTQVLQVRGGEQLRALVVKTGFDTVKGEMIRSIMFPKPLDFRIYSDFLKLIFIFVLLGAAAMIWSFFHWSRNDAVKWPIVLLNSLDLMTFVVPPIIPATITAINMWAQKRLQKLQIFCLSSNYISLAGPIDVVCFDKTGTLTEDDLSLVGIVPSEDGDFQPPIQNLNMMSDKEPLSRALATCHSVVESEEGKLIGHPLDIKIFCAVGWKINQISDRESKLSWEAEPLYVVKPLTKNLDGDLEYAVLKTFPFESSDQRMTVVAKERKSEHYEVFIKGAPEKVASLCEKESVPTTFPTVLDWYARQGLRVVAVAYSSLPASAQWNQVSSMSREMLENKSLFLGLVVLQNRLKEETTPALQSLHEANISTVMVTGDNLLTATSVARQCGLVKIDQQLIFVSATYVPTSAKAAQHLQIQYFDSQPLSGVLTNSVLKSIVHPDYVFGTDGESFQLISDYDQEIFKKLIHRGKVFARMKPDQKTEVIEALQKLGHQVAMCGDGCNDCGALKAAHAGISLSSTEASVAAPFTSLQQDIGCVANLIREGRATLISTYASFKYNIAYSFSLLLVVLFMFTVYTEPSDAQYLIMDLVLITIPSLMLGNTGASSHLCERRPSRRILHPIHIISILSFLGFQSLMYWGTWNYMETQSWFVPYNLTSGGEYHEPSYEGTLLILEAFYTFTIGAILFSHGFPFRKPIYTNRILFVYLIFSATLCIFFTFCNAEWLVSLLDFKPSPYYGFTWTIFLSIIIAALICYVWERWVLYGVIDTNLIPWLLKCYGPRYPFEKLELTMKTSTSVWPKLTDHSTIPEKNEHPESQTQLQDYDEPVDKLFRRSTKHRFRAEVKYVAEVKSRRPNKIIYKPVSTELPLTNSESNHESVFLQQDYAEPVGENTAGENLSYRNQHSFRSQLLNGQPEGGLKTFQTNLKENAPYYDAEPYEIVPLQYIIEENHSKPENIYSTLENQNDELTSGERLSKPESQVSLNTARENPHSDSSEEVSSRGSTAATVASEDVQSPMPEDFSNSEVPFGAHSPVEIRSRRSNSPQGETGLNLVKEMNNEWAILRNSLHESMKDFSLTQDKTDPEHKDESSSFSAN